jgi:hypothetical protein
MSDFYSSDAPRDRIESPFLALVADVILWAEKIFAAFQRLLRKVAALLHSR